MTPYSGCDRPDLPRRSPAPASTYGLNLSEVRKIYFAVEVSATRYFGRGSACWVNCNLPPTVIYLRYQEAPWGVWKWLHRADSSECP